MGVLDPGFLCQEVEVADLLLCGAPGVLRSPGFFDLFLSVGKANGANSGSKNGGAPQNCNPEEASTARSSDSNDPASMQVPDPFPDLPPTLWGGKARKIALALRDLGILTGYEDGTFWPVRKQE